MARGANKAKALEFGRRLRAVRTEHSHSQQEVADCIGVSRSAYTYYETGTTSPDIFMLVKIARFYDMPWQEFFARLIED